MGILSGLLTTQISAQISDDFSDGNILVKPTWYGNPEDFSVNENFQLQLNAQAGGKSILCSDLQIPDSIRWDLYCNLQFAPSATNKLRIYLMLDTLDMTLANGYFIEIGQNGVPDPVHFFSFENGEEFLLGSSTLAFDDEVLLQLSVIRDKSGNWTFYADSGTGEVKNILQLNDTTFPPGLGRLFCIECYYTSTRKDKFIFDQIVVDHFKPDNTPPVLIEARAIDSSHIELTFDENLGTIINTSDISIDPGIGNPSDALVRYHKLVIELSNELASGTTYICSTVNIPDTANNMSDIQAKSIKHIKISIPGPGDIAINEVLFDPGTDDSPFIELYNTSNNFYNCSDLVMTIKKNNSFSTVSDIADCLIYPDSFILFTNDRVSTILNYPSNRKSAIFEVDLPTLSRDFGSIVLRTRSGALIDSIYYDEGFHHISLDDTRGVSLERISPVFPGLTLTDWNSASAQSGWGTPGLPNSQYIRLDTVRTAFQIENKTFSPDGDGYEDYMLIRFADEVAGQLATARIYDEFGREVFVFFRNELIGSGSTGKWDGTTGAKDRAATGIYILLVEFMQQTGIVTTYKEAVILAAGL